MKIRPAIARGRAWVSLPLAAVIAAVLVLVNAGMAKADQDCIGSGTEVAINAALTGPGAAAVLCPGATFALHGSITFTAPNQQLLTQGLPTDGSRATLQIAEAGLTVAVAGNNQPGVVVENIQVDGNRPQFGPLAGNALLFMGGDGADQTVQHVAARNTRSWSTIHFIQGSSFFQCARGRILDNEIGPAGNDDGTISDGISVGCRDTLVQGNTIRDATDGGIVIFGSPGSLIQSNTVIADTKELREGIGMVDFQGFDGSYVGTTVTANVIDARGAFIRVAVPQGSRVWGVCGTPQYNHGASVTNNTLRGLHMGYGFAVAGVTDWNVTGNVDQSRHVGLPVQGCGGAPALPSYGFQYIPQLTANSTLQAGFQDANVSDRYFNTTEPAILRLPVQSPAGCGVLAAGEGLYPNQSLFSCDGRFKLSMQDDGNLVLYQGATPLWSTNTSGQWGVELLMQADGNLVVYRGNGTGLFSSNTNGHPGARLVIQGDGNVVVVDANNQPLWATNTCCH